MWCGLLQTKLQLALSAACASPKKSFGEFPSLMQPAEIFQLATKLSAVLKTAASHA